MWKDDDKMKHNIKVILKECRFIISDFWNNVIAASVLCPWKIRAFFYRVSGNFIGRNCHLAPRLFLGPGDGKLHVGGGTFINYDCWFDLADDIFIGENCNIAMNVHFVNATHEMGDKTRRAGRGITKPINIGSGSWIGADSIIMPGVCIGTGCIIGAGSLVLHDTDDNSIYIGRPAQKYKQIE